MARIQKNNADYFSHDADASQDEKLIYLESVFGLEGYALYFKFIEVLTRSDNFEIEWNEIKCAIYARKFGTTKERLSQFISEAEKPEIRCFCIENGRLWSSGLKKRMSPLIEKREKERRKYNRRTSSQQSKSVKNSVSEAEKGVSEAETPPKGGVSATETTQSKVKESKEENSKEKDNDITSLSEADAAVNLQKESANNFLKELESDQMVLERQQMKTHLTRKEILHHASEFNADKISVGKLTHRHYAEWRDHFLNWLPYGMMKRPPKIRNDGTTKPNAAVSGDSEADYQAALDKAAKELDAEIFGNQRL